MSWRILYDPATGAELERTETPVDQINLAGRAVREIGNVADWHMVKWDASARQLVDDLSTLEGELLNAIDAAAAMSRRRWLTMVPGQADAYREKMIDVASLNGLAGTTALILAALGAMTAAQQKARWPFLWAEKEARGLTTLVQARDAIMAAADASRVGRAEIERARRAGKIAVRAATTAAGKQAAAAAVTWPS
ncbi:hypothetical protein ABC347_10970 [Sphingomonas sp. 1P06PA]|uniref:hypothetical protein n=1 Tax=Sphingomonas sp. 1P06PA TaxID=554121 RepID=UPI0039A6DBC5